jgi:transcriptional regulator with XRE-family HTH domain
MLLNMQAESTALHHLQRALARVKRGRIATQIQIEKATGVPQSTISRARNGQLKRETPSTDRLLKYVNTLLGENDPPARLKQVVSEFLAAGGDAEALSDIVGAATRMLDSSRQRPVT